MVGPPRCRQSGFGSAPEEEQLPLEVRRSLKTQQHAHSSIDPSIEIVCPGSTPSLLGRSSWACSDDGAKIDPVLRWRPICVLGAPTIDFSSLVTGIVTGLPADVRWRKGLVPPGADPGLGLGNRR